MDTAQVLAFSLVMLNTDAHNDAIRKDRKMTLQQYKNNLRGICKDGSSPDPKMLEAMYVGICRFPWQVEEREHVVKVREGWRSDDAALEDLGLDDPNRLEQPNLGPAPDVVG